MRYDVVEVGGNRHVDVLATPRLIAEGTAPGHPLFGPRVEAYEKGGVWRVRDDSYDQPGTEYARVRVEVVR